MKQVSGKDFIRILTRHAWQLVRVNGSHHTLTKPGHRERLVIPVHGNQPLKLGLIRNQLKLAGLSEADL